MLLKRNLKLDSLLLLLGIIGLVVFIRLYPQLIPETAVSRLAGQLDRKEVLAASHKYLAEWGYTPEEFQYKADLFRNDELVRYYESIYGLVRGNEQLSRLPAVYWSVSYVRLKDREQRYVVGTGEEAGSARADVRIKMDTRGNLIELRRHLPDTVAGARLTEEEAKNIAVNALTKQRISLSDWQYEGASIIQLRSRTDYRFSWSELSSTDSLKLHAEVIVQGDKLGALMLDYSVPHLEKPHFIRTASEILRAVIVVIFIVVIVIFLFIRVRANEVDFKSGILWGIVAWAGFTIMLLSESSLVGGMWQIILGALLGGIFVGVAMWLLWITSESVGREVWNEKFYTLGRIKKGKFISETVGSAFLRGIASGILLLALAVVLCVMVNNWTPLYFDFSDSSKLQVLPLGYAMPAMFLIGTIVMQLVFTQAAVVLFGASLIKKYLKHIAAVVGIGGLLFSVAGLNLFENLEPFTVAWGINLFWGLAYFLIFVRFDFLTSFICGLTIQFVRYATMLTATYHPALLYNGVAFWIVLGAMGMVGVIAYLRTEEVDIEAFTPAYVKRITERERMQKELEAARNIQQSFLPRTTPKFEGLDIAASCIPAYEVGGDYFDFINLGEKKLGILIGDVSGKGITAAFYMTLTKGIMKAQTQQSLSPKEVMTKVNNLLYESMDRGNFISMIYGIFDMEKRCLTFTDAGHNPLIFQNVSHGKLNLLRTDGLALGLEEGKIFAQTIQEQTVPIRSGDVFVFYTDGFVEAMNKAREEFGEEQLTEVINENIGHNANVILHAAVERVKAFMGRAKQHDDMTMVVVKVEG